MPLHSGVLTSLTQAIDLDVERMKNPVSQAHTQLLLRRCTVLLYLKPQVLLLKYPWATWLCKTRLFLYPQQLL